VGGAVLAAHSEGCQALAEAYREAGYVCQREQIDLPLEVLPGIEPTDTPPPPQGNGGVKGMQKLAAERSGTVLKAIDESGGFWKAHAERWCQSPINVLFRGPNEKIDAAFVAEAAANGMDGLAGHRSTGGNRASAPSHTPRITVNGAHLHTRGINSLTVCDSHRGNQDFCQQGKVDLAQHKHRIASGT
jgi:hypothetical protein